MANEITQRNCLEAELLLGYKLFANKESAQKQKASFQQETQAVKQYEADRERQLLLFQPSNWPNIHKEYLAFCDNEKQKQKAEQKKKQEEQIKTIKEYRENEFAASKKRLVIGLAVYFVILMAGIVLTILGANGKIFDDWTFMFLPLFFLIILPTLICVPIAIARFLAMQKLKAEREKPIQTTYQTHTNNIIDFASYAKKYYSKAKLIEEYDIQHAKELEENQKTVANAKEQMVVCDKILLALDKVYDSAVKQLTEIPAFYFKADAIQKMLFFYVNKRADNIRDLINLYETTVFQESVLKSLKDISISVDRLTATVRGNFQQLGLQLGVLNESIMENTRVQRISQEKISEIKDENERHYLSIVDAMEEIELISNTYVTIK